MNVALTARFPLSIATHTAEVPEHAPDQPANVEPVAGEAVKVTRLPNAYTWEQVEPQSMFPSLDRTVPDPEPALAMLSLCGLQSAAVRDVPFMLPRPEAKS